MFSDASSGGVAISEKNISVVAPMAIDTMTAKEKNLGKCYKLWPGFKKKKAWPEIQPGNVNIPTASLKLKNICLLIADSTQYLRLVGNTC